MTTWYVYAQGASIAKGVELEFVEQARVVGDPPAALAAGDRLYPIEFPNNARSEGSVVSADAVIAEKGRKQWRIEFQRRSGDKQIWLVVDEA